MVPIHEQTHHFASLDNILISCSEKTLNSEMWVSNVHILPEFPKAKIKWQMLWSSSKGYHSNLQTCFVTTTLDEPLSIRL
jgi:hypothetical protein